VFPFARPWSAVSPSILNIKLDSREIIFEVFQPPYVITVLKRHGETDGQTDGRHIVA